MQTPDRDGLIELVSHEAICLRRYKDAKGIWTIGVGHTKAAGGLDPNTFKGEISLEEAMRMFDQDLDQYEARVRKAFKVPLTQEQFNAALSFDFNTGGIHRATWVKKFNAGDIKGARKSFMGWSKPAKLIPRRKKERDLFFDGVYSHDGKVRIVPVSQSGQPQFNKSKRIAMPDMPRLAKATREPDVIATSRPQLLKRKDEGPAVAELIRTLHDRGYYDGPLDDKFGGGTEAAVRHFQMDAGLRVDGQAGELTQNALKVWKGKPSEKKSTGEGLVYVNRAATRNGKVTQRLEQLLVEGVEQCYGPGCRSEIYSGGQPRKGTSRKRTGSVRHDDFGEGGRALDAHIFGSDGKQIVGLELAALGQWWLAQKIGGVGLEMAGGGIHLDEWSTPPRGGGMLWTYKASDLKPYGRQIRAMLEAGHRGNLPELFKATDDPHTKEKPAAGKSAAIVVAVTTVGATAAATWWEQIKMFMEGLLPW